MAAQTPVEPPDPPKPPPDVADHSYGLHRLHTFDLWLAKSHRPTPLLIHVHGGGFKSGDKTNVKGWMIEAVLNNGISVASINYRLTDEVTYPAPMHDGVRALQYLRYHARNWNLDPKRVALSGNSAGSGIVQWIAFHNELADPASSDPVARQSTRVSCVIPIHAQCTYDPREIRKIVPGPAYTIDAMKKLFGVPLDWDWDNSPISPELDRMIRDCGPITHLSADAPPILVVHYADCEVPGNIHHANFGRNLEAEARKVGVPCTRRMDTDYPDGRAGFFKECAAFLRKQFAM